MVYSELDHSKDNVDAWWSVSSGITAPLDTWNNSIYPECQKCTLWPTQPCPTPAEYCKSINYKNQTCQLQYCEMYGKDERACEEQYCNTHKNDKSCPKYCKSVNKEDPDCPVYLTKALCQLSKHCTMDDDLEVELMEF